MNPNDQYRAAVEVLRRGGLLALPTDTVYGLIAVATDDAAVRRLFEVKRRDHQQALPIFAGSLDQVRLIAGTNGSSDVLADAFWPGALTVVLPKRAAFRTLAAAGGDTIAVRVPDDPAIREMALQLGPLTGTSANRSGSPECHMAAGVRAQFGDEIDLIVDAPLAATGIPSTIVDCTDPSDPRIVRAGAIGPQRIADAFARRPS